MKMKDFPRELVINGNYWRVRFVRKMPPHVGEALGYCCPSEKEILILLGQNERERLATVWHEIFHIIEFEYEIEIGHKLIGVIEYAVADMLLKS